MRPVMLSQVALWCEGRHLGDDVEIRSVGTDTRTTGPGELFVALRGERFDAHDFVAEAQSRDVTGLLVQRPVE